jgi:hypothetical protein
MQKKTSPLPVPCAGAAQVKSNVRRFGATENRRVPLKISYTRLRIDRVPTVTRIECAAMSQPLSAVAMGSYKGFPPPKMRPKRRQGQHRPAGGIGGSSGPCHAPGRASSDSPWPSRLSLLMSAAAALPLSPPALRWFRVGRGPANRDGVPIAPEPRQAHRRAQKRRVQPGPAGDPAQSSDG